MSVRVDDITEDVRAFLNAHISSVLQLESLLFLHGNADKAWTVRALVEALRLDRSWAETELRTLCDKGIIVREEASGSGESAFRYKPLTDELHRTVQALARAYADRRVTVTSLIYAKPIDNIRVFADAFRWRKD
jgi:predicted transcriptional regulator